MAGSEAARELLHAAGSDLKALVHMLDREAFDDKVFGFHAQQAVEKTFKAWVNLLGEVHPYTHNLRVLLDQLEKLGAEVEVYWDFVELTGYAMQLRYESPLLEDAPLDREHLVQEIQLLMRRVEELLQ